MFAVHHDMLSCYLANPRSTLAEWPPLSLPDGHSSGLRMEIHCSPCKSWRQLSRNAVSSLLPHRDRAFISNCNSQRARLRFLTFLVQSACSILLSVKRFHRGLALPRHFLPNALVSGILHPHCSLLLLRSSFSPPTPPSPPTPTPPSLSTPPPPRGTSSPPSSPPHYIASPRCVAPGGRPGLVDRSPHCKFRGSMLSLVVPPCAQDSHAKFLQDRWDL